MLYIIYIIMCKKKVGLEIVTFNFPTKSDDFRRNRVSAMTSVIATTKSSLQALISSTEGQFVAFICKGRGASESSLRGSRLRVSNRRWWLREFQGL
jgi:hypothetical protein